MCDYMRAHSLVCMRLTICMCFEFVIMSDKPVQDPPVLLLFLANVKFALERVCPAKHATHYEFH